MADEAVGDAAALREALVYIQHAIDGDEYETADDLKALVSVIYRKVNSALDMDNKKGKANGSK